MGKLDGKRSTQTHTLRVSTINSKNIDKQEEAHTIKVGKNSPNTLENHQTTAWETISHEKKEKKYAYIPPSYPLELRIRFEGERNIETQERKNNSPYKCSCHSQKEVTEATKNMSCETGGEKTKETKK